MGCILAMLASGVETSYTNPYALIDGTAVVHAEQYRATAEEPFSLLLPAVNPWTSMDCEAGSFSTDGMLHDGYWLFLKPLSVGEHTLQFGTAYGDTILHATVAPEKRK